MKNNILKPIVESNNFIILDKYKSIENENLGYQSEASLEKEFIQDLVDQGYENANITNNNELIKNVRLQIERLNNITFTDGEWKRFLEEYLDHPGNTLVEATDMIHNNYIHDFIFDNGSIKNIYILDKKNVTRNKLQVISQFEQTGVHKNRYDVTILVNGLPLIQVELKRRGVAIREAFYQINRYTKESFNAKSSLFKFLQIFVISNGTDTRYFSNTNKRDKNSYKFTTNWAMNDNTPIKDLKDFTYTFFEKRTILNVLLKYSVFNVDKALLVMRPYQIAATERIIWKIQSSYNVKNWSKPESGGYIWHSTGSGKTLTSFKAAQLATQLDFIDKVFFVVDRKDLDYQTMIEYQRFSPDSVIGSKNTKALKQNIIKDDNKIVVTTIQKLNHLIKNEANLEIYNKQVVFIFDEAHRSQFGEAQKNIKKKFKKYYQFGFTGTPIFVQNASGAETTGSVFGTQLHTYTITHAIRDEKVLKFKVDYNSVYSMSKRIEQETDIVKITSKKSNDLLLHPERIEKISKHILRIFKQKTHRLIVPENGFNAMFAVNNIQAAKLYYEKLSALQEGSNEPLKIATIFSYAANEEQNRIGEIADETFEPNALDSSSKEFLHKTINDYNKMFKTNFTLDGPIFQNYYKDLAQRVRDKEVDLIIVVGMFLTGFDAPTLNTLFIDKNLRNHGLIQAFSRTNRIHNSLKSFGNIITYRDLEKATEEAIKLFGDENTKNIILEKSYDEYMNGFVDQESEKAFRGYIEIVQDLNREFPWNKEIITEKDKKRFVILFGEYLRIENILQNFDEFIAAKAYQKINISDSNAIQAFKEKYQIRDLDKIEKTAILPERILQDYRSKYNDIRDWIRKERENRHHETMDPSEDWSDVDFEIELLKSQEINLDYILQLIFKYNQDISDISKLKEEVKRLIRSSLGQRPKEQLILSFIDSIDLGSFKNKDNLLEGFFKFAQKKQKEEADQLIHEEKLDVEKSKRYIESALIKGRPNPFGTELGSLLPKMSPMNPNFAKKKGEVFRKITDFVNKFKGIGGKI